MANNDYGGNITIKFSTGEVISLRGSFTVNPSRRSNEAITNQDESVDRVGTPKPATMEIAFADRGLNYDALMRADRMNVTANEEDNDVTHYLTGAFLVGDPSINRLNGEVTGLSLAASDYDRRG
jgi:hypothetical protein